MVSLQEFLKFRDNYIRNMDVYELYIEYFQEVEKIICKSNFFIEFKEVEFVFVRIY